MITLISESNALEIVQERILYLAMSEGFVSDETVIIDATHAEARESVPVKKEEVDKEPKNEVETNLPIYGKTIVAQLDVPLSELRSTVPILPEWG